MSHYDDLQASQIAPIKFILQEKIYKGFVKDPPCISDLILDSISVFYSTRSYFSYHNFNV